MWGNVEKVVPAISKEYVKLVIPHLKTARFSIEVMMYLWGWYGYRAAAPVQRLNYEFLAAAGRGVKVRVLLNSAGGPSNLSRMNSQSAHELQRAGVLVKLDTTGQLLHSKCLIIDKEIVALGSHNYSEKSMSSNIETSVIIIDKSVALQFSRFFEQLFGRV